MTLRDEVGSRPDPQFDLELPPGWARHEVTDAGLTGLLASARDRCMAEHRPELFAEIKTYLERAFTDMRSSGVFAYFAPTSPASTTLAVPASMNAVIRRSGPGESLDDLARLLIRDHGATPLRGDPRTLRFEAEHTVAVGGEAIVNHSLTYLTPVPGSGRRRALALVAGFGRTAEVDPDAPSMRATRALFDACVATLRWHPGS